ncbi:MAG: hypothetical protein L0216_20035 [Planctomycetales bacterium]|nr:hypothetical protein [Planctomycetales bacterium]
MAVRSAGDALDEALAAEGLRREDLGWRPRGWWSRYPADIPHKLRHFDDLLAEPLATATFARTAAAALREHLAAEALAKRPEKSDGALYKAVHALGVERRFGGFRSYSANLAAKKTPLADALLAVHEAAGRPTRFLTFGNDQPYPQYRKEIEAASAPIPADVREVLGKLVLDLLDAWKWTERAFRSVPTEVRLRLARRLDLGVELTDALDYCPDLDDVARTWDEASLWYGGLKCVAALDEARQALAGLREPPTFAFDWQTPLGWVRLRGGGRDTVDATGSLLVVDLGGDDTYAGGAASAAGVGLSALLDLGGNDTYGSPAGTPAQGAGLCGVGVLLDAAGEDRYQAVECAQGFGQAGFGALLDLAGKDDYRCRFSAQGCGILGIGVLLEGAGSDTYEIHSDGQGFGGAGGVGTLGDRAGNDTYVAVRDPAITGRPSYHSDLKVAVSNAQGVGLGRRGDGADGHSWAGGLGSLLDSEGDDIYTAGNWAMGTGYWFGTGLLHDGAGNDTYRGMWWSQASVAHFAIGCLVDESGDDKHLVDAGGNNSLSFAHDFGVTLLLDVAGDDVYETPNAGLAWSINRSYALLLDLGGKDSYRAKEGTKPGTAVFDPKYVTRGAFTFFADASSAAVFLDAGGEDVYSKGGGENGTRWGDPPNHPSRAARNFSIGADVEEGTVRLEPIPERRPSGPR